MLAVKHCNDSQIGVHLRVGYSDLDQYKKIVLILVTNNCPSTINDHKLIAHYYNFVNLKSIIVTCLVNIPKSMSYRWCLGWIHLGLSHRLFRKEKLHKHISKFIPNIKCTCQ